MTSRRPIITKSIQELFLDNREMQRFLMDLSGITSDTSDIEERLNLIKEVSDIDNPTELSTLDGDLNGTMLIALQSGVYTLYEFSTTALTANSPYVVSGLSGSWVAVGGKYSDGDLNIDNDLAVGNDLTVASSSTLTGAVDAKSTFDVGGISTFAEKGTFQKDLDITLNADIGGTLGVTGISTFTAKGTFQNDLDVTLNADIGGTLGVTGISTFVSKGTFQNDLDITLNADIGGTLDVTGLSTLGATTSTGAFIANSTATFNDFIALDTPISEPSTPSTGGVLYIDSSDGDLKVKFSTGTVVTLASD